MSIEERLRTVFDDFDGLDGPDDVEAVMAELGARKHRRRGRRTAGRFAVAAAGVAAVVAAGVVFDAVVGSGEDRIEIRPSTPTGAVTQATTVPDGASTTTSSTTVPSVAPATPRDAEVSGGAMSGGPAPDDAVAVGAAPPSTAGPGLPPGPIAVGAADQPAAVPGLGDVVDAAVSGPVVWALRVDGPDGTGSLVRVGVDSTVIETTPIARPPLGLAGDGTGGAWVVTTGEDPQSQVLHHFDATGGNDRTFALAAGVRSPAPVPYRRGQLGAVAGSVWWLDPGNARFVRVDPATGAHHRVPCCLNRVARYDGDVIWVHTDDRAFLLDPATEAVSHTVTVDGRVVDVVGGAVWYVRGDGVLVRVDARTGAPLGSHGVVADPNRVVPADRRVWVGGLSALHAVDLGAGTSFRLPEGAGLVPIGARGEGLWLLGADRLWRLTVDS